MKQSLPDKKNRIMSKGKRRTLLIAAGAFLFSVSTSVTATLAYYTINSAFSIEHLNINVGSIDANLYLGLRDKTTGQPKFDNITDEEWKEGLDLSHNALEQVSAMYEKTWNTGAGEDILPKFCSAYRFGTNNGQTPYADPAGYVQKEYFLKSTQDCSLYLSDADVDLDEEGHDKNTGYRTFFIPNEEKNAVTAATRGVSVEELNNVVNAIRMSLYIEDFSGDYKYVIINPGNTEETYFGGPLDLNLDGFYDYNKDTNKEYAYGEPVAVDPYDGVGDQVDPMENSKSTFISHHKNGVAKVNEAKFKKENSRRLNEVTLNKDEGDTPNVPLATLKKDKVHRIVLSIYLEGWDKDTIDSIQEASLDVNVLFTALYNI